MQFTDLEILLTILCVLLAWINYQKNKLILSTQTVLNDCLQVILGVLDDSVELSKTPTGFTAKKKNTSQQ